MDDILTIQNISKHFEGIKAVENVSLSLSCGSVIGLYGENGAGKTTLFNLISGFEIPDSGHIKFHDDDITKISVLRRAQMGMGRLFQNPRIFPEVTVIDNLMAASKHTTGHHIFNYLIKQQKIKNEEENNRFKANQILEQITLSPKSKFKAFELSVGERKLLSLGCLLMNGSTFVLLDELSSGLNNSMISKLNELILELNKMGMTFFLIEHDQSVLKRTCSQVWKMQNGEIIKE